MMTMLMIITIIIIIIIIIIIKLILELSTKLHRSQLTKGQCEFVYFPNEVSTFLEVQK